MTTVVRRFPTFQIDLITQTTSYALTYDTGKQLNSADLEEALIQFYITNDMTNDSPAFSLVILAKDKWDKILNANDLIRIRAIPDSTQSMPDNPYILVGLISDIHKEGEYVNGTLLYRITGQAMTKALMDFQVGVIQEVSTVLPDIGWLPDTANGGTTNNGLSFTGNTAAGIGDQLMARFVYQYAQYNFSGSRTLHDFLIHSFSSWEKDEYLSDTTPFVNYQGSIRQFLEDIAAKPFNELFFEYTSQGQCIAIMRPTPFDPDMWTQLPMYKFTSDIVVEESYGKSDAEMYSIFVVSAPNFTDMTSMDIGVFPKYNPEIIKKYGYKEYSAENRYLMTPGTAESTTSSSGGSQPATITGNIQPPDYASVDDFLSVRGYKDTETLRFQRSMVYSDLLSAFQGLNSTAANGIVDSLLSNTWSKDDFNTIIKSSGAAQQDKKINSEKTVSPDKLNEFTQRLYNWYCENANFYSGDIRVIGNPAYRVGSRVLYDDAEQNTVWEFYVESIEHDFDFTQGYTTILGVTRGLPEYGANRFSNLWGQSSDFKGGYMGEQSLTDLVQTASTMKDGKTYSQSGNTPAGTAGSGSAMGALNTAINACSLNTRYVLGAGRKGVDPLTQDPAVMDCSSFVWWCFRENGVYLKGGATGMNTDTIASDPQLTIVSNRGDSKEQAMQKIKLGDIVFFDSYKTNGHVAIYAGSGNYIGCENPSKSLPNGGVKQTSLTSGWGWSHFNGLVLRYQ